MLTEFLNADRSTAGEYTFARKTRILQTVAKQPVAKQPVAKQPACGLSTTQVGRGPETYAVPMADLNRVDSIPLSQLLPYRAP